MLVVITVLMLLVFTFVPDDFPESTQEERFERGGPGGKSELIKYWTYQFGLDSELGWPSFYTQNGLINGQIGCFRKEKSDLEWRLPGIYVNQVINESKILVEIRTPQTDSVLKQNAFIYGVDASGSTMGTRLYIDAPLIVDGNEQYTTVLGASRSIPKLVPLNEKLPKHPAVVGIGIRTWKDVSGKYSIEATFDRYEKGTVYLVKRDGSEVDVKISILDSESQEFARKIIRSRSESEQDERMKDRLKKK
jgi:hypothetical protein